ncbi:MAG: DUF3783 domain-containing protein [Lachnospiraceae bacterium]|nr:DUF3783 domain-containing protein [Lachnospiraceae bacterium]
MTHIDTVLGWDESAGEVSYVLYEYEDATFNKETATIVTQGSCSGNCGSRRVYVKDKIHEGHILRLELKADEQVATSNPINVLPSPNWGTPTISFNTPAIKCDEKTVSLTVDYSDEYEKIFGDEFYCDISIYSIPGGYNDDEIKDKELWERNDAIRVGQINHSWKKETRGNLTISLYKELKAGNTLVAKLRLPHTEWEGEEEDFLSVSIPIIGAEEEVPQPTVLLYNISKDSSMGGSLYEICKELDVQIKTVSPSDLGETVGYLVGRKGYEKSQEVYSGKVANTQFMLMDGFSDGFMDTFLLSMAKHGVTIDHKAKTTMYNIEWQFHKLVDDIEEEHEEVTTLVALQTLVKEVEKVENPSKELQAALKSAKDLLATEEPGTENLKKELEALKEVYLKERNLEELAGDVILKVTPNTDGTYQVNASFDNETEHTLYSWNNGMQGKVITGVLKEDLKGLVVSLTDSTKHGKIKARFEVPGIPSIGTNATQTEITLSFAQKENKLNAPKVDKIVAVLYDAKGNEVATKESNQLDELHFTGLTAGQTYTVKAWAENVIGRSDKVEVVAATGEKSSSGGSYIAPSAPVTPSKADEAKENIDDQDTPKNDTPSVVKPAKVKKPAAKAVKHGLKLSWKKVEGATGYEIRYRKVGTRKWYTKKVKATEVSLTKLTAKRTYNVKVRAYVTTKVDGKAKTVYGNYSAVKKIKTK